jgi:hypothetical protein
MFFNLSKRGGDELGIRMENYRRKPMKPNWEVQHVLNEGRPAVSLGRKSTAVHSVDPV